MNAIKEDMLKRGLTQAEYSALLGLSQPQISYLGLGLRPVNKQTRMLMKLTTRALQDLRVND